jgi:hypothetical protein
VGETGEIDRSSKEKSESLAQRVQDLNARLQDIRREQVFQRVHSPQPLPPLYARDGVVGGDLDCADGVFRRGRRNFVIRVRVRMRGL